MSAQTASDVLGHVSTGAFGALGLLSLWFWHRRRDRPSLWAALCFGSLALVAVAGLVIPEDPNSRVERLEQHLLIVVLLLFPYFLYRFAAAFDPPSRMVELLAGGLTAALMVWTFLLPEFPAEGEPRSLGFNIYITALLVDWAALSLLVAVRLWRAGRNQPNVARRRMGLLSFAATAMTMTLLLAVANADADPTFDAATSIFAIISAAAFGLGLAPPGIVRLQWRRPELDEVREATGQLMGATTPEDVAANVLPPMARVVGAQAVFLCGEDGEVIASHGARPDEVSSRRSDEPGVLKLDTPAGSLVVWAGPYAPFFGSEEIDLLQSLGALTSLALDRTRLFVQERDAREQLERADEVKSNFIALAAHELRTPVTSVHGVVATLDRLGDQLSEQDRAELQEALRTQSDRMRRLVEQLLDLSRLDTEIVPIQPVPIAVRSEVQDVVEAEAGEQAKDVEVQVDEDLTATIDRSVLERVLSNLLTNALRHGQPPVFVSAAQRDRHFRLVVEDRGPGVPEEFVDDLFERFSRSAEARARGLGSGLGLSIARSYAQAHGGDLVYEPVKPHGARFELVVPQEGPPAGLT